MINAFGESQPSRDHHRQHQASAASGVIASGPDGTTQSRLPLTPGRGAFMPRAAPC